MPEFNSDISINESSEFGIYSMPFLSSFYSDFISVKNDSNKKNHVNKDKLSSF